MNTQAYFDNIQQHIVEELQRATINISIAVSWFTDEHLFSILCDKAKSGVLIDLLLVDDMINNNSDIDYDLLTKAGGNIWKIPTGTANDRLMHNKFCVIDAETVINGSYNWTNKARMNHESITVIQDQALALQFVEEFNAIKKQYFGIEDKRVVVDYAKICIRIEALKNVILLEDEEDIVYQCTKLKKSLPVENKQSSEIWQIVRDTEQKHYATAVVQINEYLSKQQAISIFIDSEITALQLEAKVLGLQISSLEDEKTEIEKLLYLFSLRHDKELGELIIEILRFRHNKLKEQAKQDETKEKQAEEAEQDYKNYQKNYNSNSLKEIAALNEDEQAELKLKYRQATKLCHPDMVNEQQKEQAEDVFLNLKDAYDNNDLKKVSQILSDLEKGFFVSRTETISKKTELHVTILQLHRHRDELEQELVKLKESETYKLISNIDDWDKYFEGIKKQLTEELERISCNTSEFINISPL